MNLHERLSQCRSEGKPIGFSPWRDADGELWGILLNFNERSFLIDKISVLGKPEGEREYRFSSISYFRFDPDYAERLLRLGGFNPIRSEKGSFIRDRPSVKAMLKEACRTGEVLRATLRGENGTSTIRASWCDDIWVELISFDDLMVESGRVAWRTSCVTALRWRTAYEEADEFLLDALPLATRYTSQ